MDRCFFCDRKCRLKCKGCDIVPYCSRECQRRDWKRHRVVCIEMCTPDTPRTISDPDLAPRLGLKPGCATDTSISEKAELNEMLSDIYIFNNISVKEYSKLLSEVTGILCFLSGPCITKVIENTHNEFLNSISPPADVYPDVDMIFLGPAEYVIGVSMSLR